MESSGEKLMDRFPHLTVRPFQWMDRWIRFVKTKILITGLNPVTTADERPGCIDIHHDMGTSGRLSFCF